MNDNYCNNRNKKRESIMGNELNVQSAKTEEAVVHKNIEIRSGNGLTLRGYFEGPATALEGGAKCDLIILMHGLCDSGEFDLIRKQADAYTSAGFAVLAMDFDGHGKSDGKLIDMTISKELQDAEAIIKYARRLPAVSKIIMIGHSQGGVIASIAAARHSDDVDSLVLLAPGGMIADVLRSGSCFGMKFNPDNPPESVLVFDDYLGRDYITDAMGMNLYGMADGYNGHQVLLVAGGEDPLVSEEVVKKYRGIYEKPGLDNRVEYVKVDGAPHDFCAYEIEVIDKVMSFIKSI